MIASLNGRVQEINADHIVIEIGGVGLRVFVPAPTRDHLNPGDNLFLFPSGRSGRRLTL
jgi:Holliday junction resolvasome RuvABC DNA-binding subunit